MNQIHESITKRTYFLWKSSDYNWIFEATDNQSVEWDFDVFKVLEHHIEN